MSTRWRLIEAQNGGSESAHSVVLSEDEAREVLRAEASLHEAAGWTVTLGFNDHGEPDVVIARARKTERVLTVREYDPLEDVGTWL